MSVMKQTGLLAAGCQPWNNDVCAASGDRFAYCATLAIYIYQLDRTYNEFKLHSIMSEHKKTITAISWHPKDSDLFASCSADHQIIIWNVSQHTTIAKLDHAKSVPNSIGWCLHEKEAVAFVGGRGPLFIWNFGSTSAISAHRDAQGFSSDICQFRWHHKKIGKLVLGHADGSISLFSSDKKKNHKHVLQPDDEDSEDEDPVTGLEWDPLSVEYLLVSNSHFGVRLLDTESLSPIMAFKLPSVAAHTQTLAWINSAPGMFLTGDAGSGVMRLWNVSKSSPVENIRIKQTGFHALHVFSTAPCSPGADGTSTYHMSSNSSANCPSGTNNSRFALPPAHAVCTFRDGGVGLYDLGKRRWDFLRDLGHVETIFDCKFKPDNPDLLATASFDGTIKVWNINTMTALHTSPGNEGVIYAVSWAPSDLNCIAACTSRHGAFIWDISKGKIIKRFTEHGKSSVYSVAWCLKDSRRIATCGADGYCVVRQIDGQSLQRYKHPAPVFGCDWSPNNKDMIATGCDDKYVRVFYLATTSEHPLKTFIGHTSKVFQVKWSPLREGILCSGSDDGTIRIWDYTQDACIQVLTSHTAPVRGLLWNTEIPYLLISGSWDYSIRIWDTRDGACIDTVLDHGADVYGLTSHPRRPFVLASCSRDSTVRIWSLLPLIQPLEMNVIARRPLSDIIALPECAMSTGSVPLLAGRISKELKLSLDNPNQGDVDAHCQRLKQISTFFMKGVENLWELVSVINGLDDSLLSKDYSDGIMHMKHITRFKGSQAQELEMAKVSALGLRSRSREEGLREAANMHIKLGNVQRYCETQVELGEWEKALSVAPAVSMNYWQGLVQRHADFLVKQNDEQAIPYCVASGNPQQLVDFLIRQGRIQDAMTTATVAFEGAFNHHLPGTSRKNQVNGVEASPELTRLLHETSSKLADWYFRSGLPVNAACCHLAVEDCKLALSKLIRGNELELAASIGTVLKNAPTLTNLATTYLSRRCERLAKWDLAVDLLKTIDNSSLPLAKLCARCTGSISEINSIHERAGVPSMEDCLVKAEDLSKESNTFETVKYFLMSTAPEKGLILGLHYLKECMKASNWMADDVIELVDLLSSIRTEVLLQSSWSTYRAELLAATAYIGALVAIQRHYNPIVPALFENVIHLLGRDSPDVSISVELCNRELEAWRVYCPIDGSRNEASKGSPGLKAVYDDLIHKCGKQPVHQGVGPDFVSGSNLPSHSDVHQSYLTHHRIQGAAFFLEDGMSALSINEALMWAKVNAFSPLCSGVRINPF